MRRRINFSGGAVGFAFVLLLCSACGTETGNGGGATNDATTADSAATDSAATDTAATDAGTKDAVSADSGALDAGVSDTGVTDAGSPDAGSPDAIVVGPDGCSMEVPCGKGGAMCFSPGQSMGCGICMKPIDSCQQDSDCAAVNGKPAICEYRKTDCTCGGEKLCHVGCAVDSECGVGEACGADHHCGPKPCSAAAPCPANFSCGGVGCARTTCKTSAACPAGICVNSGCFAKPGFCSFPPP